MKLHESNIANSTRFALGQNGSRRRPATVLTSGIAGERNRGMHCAFALVLVLLLGLVAFQARAEQPYEFKSGTSPFISVSHAVRPAVVNIRITKSVNAEGVGTGPLQEMYRQFFPDEEGKGGRFESPSTGSGFVVTADGDILTNHHVIADADAIFVRFSGEKREYRAELVGSDPNTDLALLRIDPAGRQLPTVEFGDSEKLEVGAWAIAIGNPFGNLESTLTVGVVSAKGRGDLEIGGLTPRYQDFIQTDASINFGNSGGPLVDIEGRVVGVNTAISQRGQGIGFAVPSRLVQVVYEQLKTNGRVIRGYLGAVTEDVVQIVGEEVDGEPPSGARVVRVVADSPAAAAGLLAGDVVVEFDGRPVDSRRRLLFLIAAAEPGQDVQMTYVRDGKRSELRVRPVEWIDDGPAGAAPVAALWLGMEVASLDGGDPRVARLKDALGVTATTGVMVVAVQEDQPAADAGIRPGDVIFSLADQEIMDLDSYTQVRTQLASSREPLLVRLRTGGLENSVMIQPRSRGVEN